MYDGDNLIKVVEDNIAEINKYSPAKVGLVLEEELSNLVAKAALTLFNNICYDKTYLSKLGVNYNTLEGAEKAKLLAIRLAKKDLKFVLPFL
jgi:hypothetical protein